MAPTIQVGLSNFDDVVSKDGVVFLDCSAKWCGPCRVFAPIFHAAAAARPEHTWGTIDTDDEPALTIKLDVRANPTIVVFKDGALVYKHVGAMSAAKLDALVEKLTA